MWTEITRPKYERTGQRYASDLTDREWAVIAPLMPAPKRLGRPRETDLRAVLDAILYIARSGCQWRLVRKACACVADVSDWPEMLCGGANGAQADGSGELCRGVLAA